MSETDVSADLNTKVVPQNNQDQMVDRIESRYAQSSSPKVDRDEIRAFVRQELHALNSELNEMKTREEMESAKHKELREEIEKGILNKLQEEYQTKNSQEAFQIAKDTLASKLDKLVTKNKLTKEEFDQSIPVLAKVPYGYKDLANLKSPVLKNVVKRLSDKDSPEVKRLLKYQAKGSRDQFDDVMEDIIYTETKKHLNSKKLKEADNDNYTSPSFSSGASGMDDEAQAMLKRVLARI